MCGNERKKEMVPSKRRPGWQTKHVYNDTLQTVNQRIAKFVRQEPGWNTIAATEDPGDKVVQKTSDQVMSWEWSDGVRMPEKVETGLACAMTDRISLCASVLEQEQGSDAPHQPRRVPCRRRDHS
jgi:hypothetical protein